MTVEERAVEDRIDLRDRAVQVALSFAGKRILSSDGSYDLLITIVQDAMEEWAKAHVEAEREACANTARLAKEESERIISTTDEESAYRSGAIYIASQIEHHIRARSEGEKKGE